VLRQGGGDGVARELNQAVAIFDLHPGGDNRVVKDDLYAAGMDGVFPGRLDLTAADNSNGYDRRLGLDGHYENAFFEITQPPVRAPGPFRKRYERVAFLQQLCSKINACVRLLGIQPLDWNEFHMLQNEREDRKPHHLFLDEGLPVARYCVAQNRAIEISLVIGKKNVRCSRRDFFPPLLDDFNAAHQTGGADAEAPEPVQNAAVPGNPGPHQADGRHQQDIDTHECINQRGSKRGNQTPPPDNEFLRNSSLVIRHFI
jgi:hypothetical protein